MGSKPACIVDATVVYDKPETVQVVIFLIHHVIEMKSLNHHLLHPMQCSMNGVLINEVPKFFAPIPSETTYAIQILNPFDATHLIIIIKVYWN